jgi:hypothetical protein
MARMRATSSAILARLSSAPLSGQEKKFPTCTRLALSLCAIASLSALPAEGDASETAKPSAQPPATTSCALCPPTQPSGQACPAITAPAGSADLPYEPYRWSVNVSRVECRTARRIAVRYLRANDSAPGRGWRCDRDASGVGCFRGRSRRTRIITARPKHPIGRACGKVALESEPTDHVAVDVRAIKISCRDARTFARKASLLDRSPTGWRCARQFFAPSVGLHYAHWVCRKSDSRRVRWLEY